MLKIGGYLNINRREKTSGTTDEVISQLIIRVAPWHGSNHNQERAHHCTGVWQGQPIFNSEPSKAPVLSSCLRR